MSKDVVFSYHLSKELWRLFFEAHYSRSHHLKMRYLWGVTCIIIGSLGFGGFYESRVIALLLLTTGFYGVLSRQILVVKSLRSACRHPFFGKELTVRVSPEELSVRSGDAGYSQPWHNFVGYRRLAPGFLLYHDQNSFFFIPVSAMGPEHAESLQGLLKGSEVPELS